MVDTTTLPEKQKERGENWKVHQGSLTSRRRGPQKEWGGKTDDLISPKGTGTHDLAALQSLATPAKTEKKENVKTYHCSMEGRKRVGENRVNL